MGYYTNYDLSELSDEVVERVNEISGYNFSNSYTSDGCKWYKREEDMREVSKEFPGELLVISGEGEESGDIWRAYFKNGKCWFAPAKIVFEEFDESKLN